MDGRVGRFEGVVELGNSRGPSLRLTDRTTNKDGVVGGRKRARGSEDNE